MADQFTGRTPTPQRYRSELFWSATTGGHVAYGSRLELDWLLPADFDKRSTPP